MVLKGLLESHIFANYGLIFVSKLFLFISDYFLPLPSFNFGQIHFDVTNLS